MLRIKFIKRVNEYMVDEIWTEEDLPKKYLQLYLDGGCAIIVDENGKFVSKADYNKKSKTKTKPKAEKVVEEPEVNPEVVEEEVKVEDGDTP